MTRWSQLAGRTPRGLRRWGWLDRLGWYEPFDMDTVTTSTRQAVALCPAVVESSPAFGGAPLGIDDETGMYHGSDPFVLYEADVIQSLNVLVVGDVGVAKSTLVKDHYVGQSLRCGRQVCVFDRKDQTGQGEYDRAATYAEQAGLRVARIRFARSRSGACVNPLDPRISRQGSDDAGRVGQDELLEMLATELRGTPLSDNEHHALAAAHRAALTAAAGEGRDPVLSDVVRALFDPDEAAVPTVAGVRAAGISVEDVAGWGRGLGMALARTLRGDLSGLIDGPTSTGGNSTGDASTGGGEPIDLSADLIVVDTSELAEGSAALMVVMAIMTTFVSSAWAASPRQSVVVIEEGYSAAFPTVGHILRALAKRGRGIGALLVFVLHHLSDVPPGSPLAALFKEVGIAHVFRQWEGDDADAAAAMFGLHDFRSQLARLRKGSHILIEGADPTRPRRLIWHVQTGTDKWITYTDKAVTGDTAAEPANPFTTGPDSLNGPDNMGGPDFPASTGDLGPAGLGPGGGAG